MSVDTDQIFATEQLHLPSQSHSLLQGFPGWPSGAGGSLKNGALTSISSPALSDFSPIVTGSWFTGKPSHVCLILNSIFVYYIKKKSFCQRRSHSISPSTALFAWPGKNNTFIQVSHGNRRAEIVQLYKAIKLTVT